MITIAEHNPLNVPDNLLPAGYRFLHPSERGTPVPGLPQDKDHPVLFWDAAYGRHAERRSDTPERSGNSGPPESGYTYCVKQDASSSNPDSAPQPPAGYRYLTADEQRFGKDESDDIKYWDKNHHDWILRGSYRDAFPGSTSYCVKAVPPARVHNPRGVPESALPAGYRFLTVEEFEASPASLSESPATKLWNTVDEEWTERECPELPFIKPDTYCVPATVPEVNPNKVTPTPVFPTTTWFIRAHRDDRTSDTLARFTGTRDEAVRAAHGAFVDRSVKRVELLVVTDEFTRETTTKHEPKLHSPL